MLGKAALALAVMTVTIAGAIVTALFSLEFVPLLPSDSMAGAWRYHQAAATRDAGILEQIRLSRTAFGTMSRPTAMTLFRQTTEDGAPLSGGCSYRIEGPAPHTLWWSLGVHPLRGENGHEAVSSVHSAEIHSPPGMPLRIEIAPGGSERPSLSSRVSGPFVLVLRLVGPSAALLDPSAADLPRVSRQGRCP